MIASRRRYIMNKFKSEWDKMSLKDKLIFIATILLGIGMIVFSILLFFTGNDIPIIINQVLFLAFMVIQCIRTWKKEKVVFILSLCAVFLMLCSISIYILL